MHSTTQAGVTSAQHHHYHDGAHLCNDEWNVHVTRERERRRRRRLRARARGEHNDNEDTRRVCCVSLFVCGLALSSAKRPVDRGSGGW